MSAASTTPLRTRRKRSTDEDSRFAFHIAARVPVEARRRRDGRDQHAYALPSKRDVDRGGGCRSRLSLDVMEKSRDRSSLSRARPQGVGEGQPRHPHGVDPHKYRAGKHSRYEDGPDDHHHDGPCECTRPSIQHWNPPRSVFGCRGTSRSRHASATGRASRLGPSREDANVQPRSALSSGRTDRPSCGRGTSRPAAL
jgi:hypothetical protein